MKFSNIYVVLLFCLLGSTTVFAQSMLEQYFGGNKNSRIKEATQTEVYAIDLPEHGKINIAGHLMGGGVALGYAMEKQYEQPDGFLLINLPETVPLKKYTHRANTSRPPDDYVTGLKVVKAPILVLIGSNDEAFSAEALQKAVLENSSEKVPIIDKASHNGIRHNTQSFTFIKDWF